MHGQKSTSSTSPQTRHRLSFRSDQHSRVAVSCSSSSPKMEKEKKERLQIQAEPSKLVTKTEGETDVSIISNRAAGLRWTRSWSSSLGHFRLERCRRSCRWCGGTTSAVLGTRIRAILPGLRMGLVLCLVALRSALGRSRVAPAVINTRAPSASSACSAAKPRLIIPGLVS